MKKKLIKISMLSPIFAIAALMIYAYVGPHRTVSVVSPTQSPSTIDNPYRSPGATPEPSPIIKVPPIVTSTPLTAPKAQITYRAAVSKPTAHEIIQTPASTTLPIASTSPSLSGNGCVKNVDDGSIVCSGQMPGDTPNSGLAPVVNEIR